MLLFEVLIVALFFPGKTKCSICGPVVNDDDTYVGTSRFHRRSE